MNKFNHLRGCKPRGYPVRHKAKVPFAPIIDVPDGFVERSVLISRCDQDMDSFILGADDYTDLLIESFSSNVHKTTSLEGNPLTEGEVRRITRRTFTGEAPILDNGGPMREIINHLRIPLLEEQLRPPWDHDTIRSLHRLLLEGTDENVSVGAYRSNRAVVVTDDGIQELFIPCPPEHIGREMGALLDWVNHRAGAYNPIVAATVFFHEFESIHPFKDGNGRVGRTLFNLLLRAFGLRNINKCKLEQRILYDPELYYEMLAYTDDSSSYRELIDMFSIATLQSYREALEEFRGRDLLSSGIDEETKTLLLNAKRLGTSFTISEATGWVEGIGYQMVRKRLNDLVDLGGLEKLGRGRGLRFHFNDPMERFSTIIHKETRLVTPWGVDRLRDDQ